MKKNILTLILSLTTLPFIAQDFSGKITFEIDYDLPEAMEPQRSMLPTEMITHIGKQHSKVIQNTMLGEQITIINFKTKITTSLINLMGQKIAIEMGDIFESSENSNKPTIEYIDDSKTIAGYECKKAIYTITTTTDDIDEKIATEIYYSPEIPAQSNHQFKDLKGLPLEYSVTTQGMTMKIKAISVTKEKYTKKVFEIPSDYEKMTMEEFQKMMGQ